MSCLRENKKNGRVPPPGSNGCVNQGVTQYERPGIAFARSENGLPVEKYQNPINSNQNAAPAAARAPSKARSSVYAASPSL